MVVEGLGPGEGPTYKNINTRTSPNYRQSPGQARPVGQGGGEIGQGQVIIWGLK